MWEQIVTGYAGDPPSRDAALLTSRLARLSGAAVAVAVPAPAEQHAREDVSSQLEREPLPVDVRFRPSHGSWPVRALHELADEERADLIVFGAAASRGDHLHPDLMARMVHGAPCAVAVAPDGYRDRSGRPQTVGVGFADTAEGAAAIAVAAELAGRTGGGVRVIAAAGLSSGTLAAYAGLSPVLEEDLLEETSAAAQQAIARAAGDVPLELDVRRGDPVRALVSTSAQLDLLVLGSRAYGPVRHALLGSVSADVMRDARCPVIVVPRPTLDSGHRAQGADGVARHGDAEL